MLNRLSGGILWPALSACLRCSAATLVVVIALISTGSPTSQSSPQQKTEVVADFGTRVSRYLELRLREAGPPSKSSKSSQRLVEQQQEMAAKIQAARSGVKQGNIFSRAIVLYFRNQVKSSLRGPDGRNIRATLEHSEPIPRLTLRVNDSYPPLPLQTMPASLLQRLPLLPKELEYRIIGHDLVLHDIEPNIIVDFIPGVIPTRP